MMIPDSVDLPERTAPSSTWSTARSWALRIVPPLVAFLCARARLYRSARFAHVDGLSAQAYSRWDSAHYLKIAQDGYEFFSCARLPGYDPSEHCGNCGWLPAFPLAVRGLTQLHIEPVLAGSIVAGVFALATLVLMWNAFLGPESSAAGLLTLALAAFFPGHVYEHAVFPISMCAFFQVLSLRLYCDGRYAWAGVAGACAAFTYSSAIFLAGVFALHLLGTQWRQGVPRLALRGLASAGVLALGFAAFLLLLQLEVGHWNAYFLVQAKYKFGLNAPWSVFAKNIHHAFSAGPPTQTLFVGVLAIALLWAAVRQPHREVDSVLALFLLCYWLVPLTLGGQLSIYRAEAVLLPAAPLAAKLPLPVLAALAASAIYLASKMAVLFFASVLV
jgi:hypothetical protein